MSKLRLVVTERCNRNCEGCCMKAWKERVPKFTGDYADYDEVLLTGGEPLLEWDKLTKNIREIRRDTSADIFLYTAYRNKKTILALLMFVDGITLTFHEQSDTEGWNDFQELLLTTDMRGKSLRLNVFEGISLEGLNLIGWKVKDNMHWIEDCPLPEGEVIRKL